jgi:hypothetical protein
MHFVWSTNDVNVFHRFMFPLLDSNDFGLQARSPVSLAHYVIHRICID